MITKPLISILLLALVLFSSCSKSDLDDTLTEGVGEFVDNFLDIALPGIINLTEPKSKKLRMEPFLVKMVWQWAFHALITIFYLIFH